MTPAEIVDKMMLHDQLSHWLGIEIIAISAGHAVLQMHVREEMVNGFHIAHGGITYSLSDSALAFAANSHGKKCVSIETSISHTRPVKVGDVLTAEAKELNCGQTLAIYEVVVKNADHKVVALFKGTVLRSDEAWS
jgi:acyl-CoA thioesterase